MAGWAVPSDTNRADECRRDEARHRRYGAAFALQPRAKRFGAGRRIDIRSDPLRRGHWRIRIPRAWRRFRVFVFRTFEHAGLVFLYACSLDAALLLPACACRMLSAAALNLNNMRDIQNDALKGKRTILVRIGLRRLSAITSH